MSDMNKRGPDDCDDGERGERGERGKRGKRGHRGHDGERGERGERGEDGATGPTGPTGPFGVGFGLLKFSGAATVLSEEGPAVSFLADHGVGLGGASVLSLAPSYPVAIDRSLRNMAVNVLGFIVPLNGSILVELLQDGIPVPGFAITYGPGETGIKTVAAGPTPYAIGSTFDVRVTIDVEVSIAPTVNISATVGVE